MQLPIDILTGTYKKPRFFLCETDKEIICELTTADTRCSFKFNGLSELSFEVSRFYIDEVTGEAKVNPYYSKIEAFRLIFVEGFGYFELQGPELNGDGIKESKVCTANSLEYTLSTKYLEDFYVNTGKAGSIEVTYAEDVGGNINNIEPVTLYNPNNTDLSLLHLVLEKAYGWSIRHVDPSLQTLSRQFEVDRASIYDFLMNEVCEKFNCYIVFDTIKNEINIYAESLTAKFIGDGVTNQFIISPPFDSINTVSVAGYKTTRWQYNNITGALVLEDVPVSGAHIEVVDSALTEWETDVFVSFENLAQEININYDSDNIKTVLTVTYGDEGNIREVNLGLPYLTDLSYYYTVDWMGQDLYDAYTRYLQKTNSAQSDYTNNSQEISKLNDKIYYEKTRLSLEYSLVQSVTSTTVGTYYVRRTNSDGTFYYKEVSLPGEYDANEKYYANLTANVTEDKMEDLYSVLQKYFNNEDTDDNSGDKKITSWKTDLDELQESFEFMETYPLSYLSTELSKVTTNRTNSNAAKVAINNFLSEVWSELGKYPLEQLYLAPYETRQQTNMGAGWSNADHNKYPYYYPVILYIDSINAAIKIRDDLIKAYETERGVFEKENSDISNDLLMDKNFTDTQLIRLSSFLREDELTLDDIVETSQDDLSSSFKVKQDAMESGRIELQKLCQPQLQFSMTMANIYALPEFAPIVKQFQLGKVIRVALRQDYIKQSRLLQVDLNFDDFSDFSCEFGELTNLRSQSDIHADLLSNAISAGKSVATSSSYWTKGADTATSTDLKIQQGLLDAATQIKAIDGTQGVTIDKYGIHLRKDVGNGEYDDKQGWITNNQFLYSDDGFKTTRSVFGEFKLDGQTRWGLMADAVVAGHIEGTTIKGSVIHGSTIHSGAESADHSTSYFDVSTDGLLTAHNALIYGTVYAGRGEISGWTIDPTGLSYGYIHSPGPNKERDGICIDPKNGIIFRKTSSNANGYDDIFTVDKNGKMTAKGADITGKITADTGYIGGTSGWVISSNTISHNTGNSNGKYSYICAAPREGSWLNYLYFNEGENLFLVDYTGHLRADSANIAGVLTAGVGSSLGPWSVSSDAYGSYIEGTSGKYKTTLKVPSSSYIDDNTHNGVLAIYDGTTYPFVLHGTGRLNIGELQIYNGKISNSDGNGSFPPSTTGITLTDYRPYCCVNMPNQINATVFAAGSSVSDNYGSANFRVRADGAVWCRNGLYNSGNTAADYSDRSLKNSIELINDKYNAFFDNLKPVTYKYNCGTSNRIHIGYIAQDVTENLEENKLTTQEFAGVVYEPEEGVWYLRYSEFIALNTWQIQKAKARIDELEEKIIRLEELININKE